MCHGSSSNRGFCIHEVKLLEIVLANELNSRDDAMLSLNSIYEDETTDDIEHNTEQRIDTSFVSRKLRNFF